MTTTPPVPVRLAALDIAGTTVEEHGAVYDALHDAILEAGGTATVADVQHWMGAEKGAAIRALLSVGSPAAPDDERVARTFGRFTELLSRAYAARPPVPLPGVPEAIAALREAGVAVALTTGFTREVTAGILDALGWRTGDDRPGDGVVLDAVVCADEVPAGRPAPYMVHRAMERTGVDDVAAVLTAGDTVLDLRAGTRAGAGVVAGVLTGRLGDGPDGLAALRAEPHDVLLDSVADLPRYLAERDRSPVP